MKLKETVENRLRTYGKETFPDHRKEVYGILKLFCHCLEFLQNQENWHGRRAIPLRKGYCEQSQWEKDFPEEYDRWLRHGELLRLDDRLEDAESWLGEGILLRNFFLQGFSLLLEEADGCLEADGWKQLMEIQMETNGYRDYRAFLEAVYMVGFQVLHALQDGSLCHFFAGDFRDSAYLLEVFREWIPQEEYGEYDAFCAELLKELTRERRAAIEEILNRRDQGLERAVEEIPALMRFRRHMEDMEEDDFEEFVKNRLVYEEDWEDVPEWTPRMNLHGRIWTRVRELADLFAHGGSSLKGRLFSYLTEEEQRMILEHWMETYYPDLYSLSVKMSHQMDAVDPEPRWLREEEQNAYQKEEIVVSLERIAGRPPTEEETCWL